jgi:hypothetical protein
MRNPHTLARAGRYGFIIFFVYYGIFGKINELVKNFSLCPYHRQKKIEKERRIEEKIN